MKRIILQNTTDNNDLLQAVFIPDRGMNLVSLKKNGIEIIDPSTWDLFEERYAGLGALIGPHFHHREDKDICIDFDTTLFPHIEKQRAKGIKEPFSHGIARYAPWKFQSSGTQIKAYLNGKDTWKGLALKRLEGMDFEMSFEATLMTYGLWIRYGIFSEKPSVIGLHYYYLLPQKKGRVEALVKEKYSDQGIWKPIPAKWLRQAPNKLSFDLDTPSDFGFLPILLPENRILLHAIDHEVHLLYESLSGENSWQLWHPERSSFVCIEPLSAINPRKPIHNHSLLEVKIEIF